VAWRSVGTGGRGLFYIFDCFIAEYRRYSIVFYLVLADAVALPAR
jgi:hypothetical protein